MTTFFEWSDALSVGVDEIDNQHKVLLGLVNEMHEAIQARHSTSVVGGVLERLADYTQSHFAAEENLMRLLRYPGYAEHKAQHEALMLRVVEFQQKVDAGKTAIGFELMHFLKVWLTGHIMSSDQRYVECLIDVGVKAKLKQKSWAGRLRDRLPI
ncbi:bacteriohemerythrin [uncultured Thiodictyon sp.]|uniref:bacteriohemerythrin n=1 Tax=uncultured Thiodictyon sp. TaxID=1846217 RepID=UPI0025CE7071|nr:bacteriohemerythrin [uncultured Thiodictyon sp.]